VVEWRSYTALRLTRTRACCWAKPDEMGGLHLWPVLGNAICVRRDGRSMVCPAGMRRRHAPALPGSRARNSSSLRAKPCELPLSKLRRW
jgi:hypothetical protein